MNIHPIFFNNPGAMLGDVPQDTIDELKQLADAKFNDRNRVGMQDQLVGEMQHEYEFHEAGRIVDPLVRRLMSSYFETFGLPGVPDHHVNMDNINVNCLAPWINYQYKHEFNPVHMHNGNFSYVMWLDIPYTSESEQNLVNDKRKGTAYIPERMPTTAGQFMLWYTSTLGDTQSLAPDIDALEGKIILFPSSLNHSVYPFYSSDKPRISLAGNVIIEEKHR